MAKKQDSNEQDWLDQLKKSMESEDILDTEDAYADADEGDDDFNTYLADLIGKQTADFDGGVLPKDSAEEPLADDDRAPWEDYEAEDIEIEEIGETEEIEQIEEIEKIQEADEEIAYEPIEEAQEDIAEESAEVVGIYRPGRWRQLAG